MTTLRAVTGSSRRPSTRRDLRPLSDTERYGQPTLPAGDSRRCARVLLVSSLVTLGAVLVGWFLFTLISGPLVTSMYRGESLPVLNHLIRDHTHTPLEYYLASSRVQFSRLVVLAVCMQAIVVAGILWQETRRTVTAFFTATSPPINLAVLRIVFFAVLFHSVDVEHVVWFSKIPPELRFPPIGVGWLLPYVPLDATTAAFTAAMLRVCCLSALVGFFSRTSAGLAALLSVYVLGIPQLYGKVNHYHYLVAFAAILAASPCGDALSVDAVRNAWRRTNEGQTAPPGPSISYALPLRFVWLLMGLLYFFPGFWKLWSSGFDWAFSDNLRLQMHSKWLEFGDWTPFFRLDQHPALSRMSALFTIGFEISFVFLIFFPSLRLLALLGGLVFHTLTYLFMGISFNVTAFYVAFVDWSALLMRLGRWLFPEALSLVFDGRCRTCRRTIAMMRAFDVFGRVSYVDARDPGALRLNGLGWLNLDALERDVHAVIGYRSWTGAAAYRVLGPRTPLLRPVLPLLTRPVADRIYRHVADSRACRFHEPTGGFQPRDGFPRAIVVVGTFLVVGNLGFGALKIGNAWPVACYPTFHWIATPEVASIEVDVARSSGEVPISLESLSAKLDSDVLRGLIGNLLYVEDPTERALRLRSFWALCEQLEPGLADVNRVLFYRVTLATDPELRRRNPVQRELLAELKVGAVAAWGPPSPARSVGSGSASVLGSASHAPSMVHDSNCPPSSYS
jgi:predicted DCC family thiol-disulfide oxidoreductase YuxK